MKKFQIKEKTVEALFSTAIALLVGFLLGALLLRISGYDPVSVYKLMFDKIVADFGLVVGKATPLIFTGLAMAIPYSIGMVNLGAEGQIAIGAFCAALIGAYIPLPSGVHVLLVLAGGALAGMLCSTLCGFLKLRFQASEVVTTVMLNSVILYLMEYAVNGPLNGVPSQPQTRPILETAYLPKFSIRAEWSTAIFIALAAAILVWVFINKTVAGYEMRASGLNLRTSLYKGINVKASALLAMALGGLFAGLGGACEVMGLEHSYYHGFVTNYGYTGMAVALIARNNPLAVIPAAIFLAMIRVGGVALDRMTDIPSHFIWVLQGTMIIALSVPHLLELLKRAKTAVQASFRKKTVCSEVN